MNIIDALIRRRVLTSVLVLIAAIMGALSYFTMGVRRFPDVDFPVAVVSTAYPGAAPEEIESEITTDMEDAVSTVAGIDEIESYSQHGLSLTLIQFDLEEDIDIKAMDLRDEIDIVREQLPDDAEDPVVQKFDPGQTPVVTLALTGSGDVDVNELFRLAEEELEDPLSQVPGVAEVETSGGQTREIHVLVDPLKMRAYDISPGQVGTALAAANVEISAGEIIQPEMEYTVRTRGKFNSVEEIGDIPVSRNDNSTVYVRDIAEIQDTYEDEETRSRANGRNSVVLTVQKQTDANDVEISDGVQERLPELRERLAGDMELFITEDNSDSIRGALSNVGNNIVIGMVLTALALYFFFSSWRGTIIAGVVMPSALIITFVFLMYSGVSVNILTLTALALSVGIIVNNSILILENAHRLVEEGLEPVEAAVIGTRDIGLAILSSTATNLVVFLPIAFMGEIIGRFFREFGLTIVFVTVVSLLVSFSLTPMMCGLLLKHTEHEDGNWMIRLFHGPARAWQWGVEWVKANYLGVLKWCLKWRKTTLLLTVVLVALAGLGMFTVVGAEFFPRSDEGSMRITMETSMGSSLGWTAERVKAVERVIEEHVPDEYLQNYYSRVGKVSGFVGGVSTGKHLGEISVSLTDAMDRPESVYEIMNDLRPHLARVHSTQITTSAESGAGPGGAPLEIDIYGTNMEELQELAGEVLQIVAATPGTTDVDQSYRTGRPDIGFRPDHAALRRHQLDAEEVGRTLRTYVEGDTPTELFDEDEEYDIRVRLPEAERRWGKSVGEMFIRSPRTNELIPISELGTTQYTSSPVSIMRKDRERLITISSELTGERSLGEVRDDIDRKLDEKVDPPENVRVNFGGEVDMMSKNFRELFQAMATASVLTFLCTAGMIESFFLAIVIILTIPVSFIGVTLALVLGGVALNVFSLMAMIMLVGMVVNNAIIVLDYATREDQMDMPPWKRVYAACSLRFRVIVMANLTTIAAMIPLSLGLGFAGEIFRPLALVQIGGIAAAGSLALVVIPVIYTSWRNFIEGETAE
ncbi:MAG: efflux RND transporter permease subunit [Candidatus Brocadiia bacterium]